MRFLQHVTVMFALRTGTTSQILHEKYLTDHLIGKFLTKAGRVHRSWTIDHVTLAEKPDPVSY